MFKDNESKYNTCLSGIYLAAKIICRESGHDTLNKEAFIIGHNQEWAQFSLVTSQLHWNLFMPSLRCQSGIPPGRGAV